MKPFRWWAPVASALAALAFGLVPYAAISHVGSIPAGLRDNPWPLELVAVAATVAAIVFMVQAYRQKRVRVVATSSAAVAALGTAVFLLLVHVVSYELPPAPKELAVGAAAPEFVLPDSTGKSVALASLRGHPTVLVFFRGVW